MSPARINVVGSSCSGKSTFAKRLAASLDIPYIEMDRLYWKPNWVESSDDELYANLTAALASEAWVLDGNYSRTTPIKWSRTQNVIWLDPSFPRTAYRSFKRATIRAANQQEIWPGTGNRESFRKSFFSHDSIILWCLSNFWKIRGRYLNAMADPAHQHIQFIRLRTPRETESFLRAAAK